MECRHASARAIILALIVVLTGCATADRKTGNPERSRLGVLIIAGEGLNSIHNDLKLDAVLFQASTRFAELVYHEIQKRGTKAQLYINRDRSIKPDTYVSRLLVDDKRDGLIQVTITHVKNEAENSIYLSADYFPLRWQKDVEGESVLTGSGPKVKHKIGEKNDRPFDILAQEFAEELFKTGYIGKD